MPLAVGAKAPDFALRTKSPEGVTTVNLSDHLGKENVVLLFYPGAFTHICTQEMCDVTQGINAYSGLNADIIGISVDSPFAQEAWAQKEKIGLTIASDLNKKVAESYGTLLPDLLGMGAVSARAAFVIDRHGAIQYSEQTPTPKDLPNFKAIQDTLAKLK